MYTIFTRSKTLTLVAAAALAVSGAAFAKERPEKPFAPGKPGDATILETALAVNAMGVENEDEGVGEFAYLVGAVNCLDDASKAAVIGLLTGDDNYTLFAPTNEAFRNLQRALTGDMNLETSPEISCAVDTLLGEGTLFTVLAYHLTEGRRFSNSVFNRNNPKDIEMLAAGTITTTPSLTIIDGAMQTVNPVASLINVKASNGVIHVIDTVLLPFAP